MSVSTVPTRKMRKLTPGGRDPGFRNTTGIEVKFIDLKKEIPNMPGSEEFDCGGSVVARVTPCAVGLYYLDFLSVCESIPSGNIQVFEWRFKRYVRISPIDRHRTTTPEAYIYHVHPRLCYKICNVRDNVERFFSFPPKLLVEPETKIDNSS